ncbi:MAG TPA: hypothetical protein VH143_34695 [Kofleriaceae bacterium]|jgi:hypothetical protein|nr:hypothetical protein [Kofleriaceae bacterium]
MRKIPLRHLLSKLTVLALSASPGLAVAQAMPATQSADCADDGDLDSDSVIDRDNIDPRDAAAMLGRSLANALGEVTPLSATHLATTWALSTDPLRRAAIANALEWQFPLYGDAAIIEHLSRDPSSEIRAAIARAAWIRHTAPVDGDALRRLLDDADPEVRAIARRAQV